jgi:hypothetical protein
LSVMFCAAYLSDMAGSKMKKAAGASTDGQRVVGSGRLPT